MTLKINPFHQLLWRTPHSLQIGVGTKARIFENVSREEERLIDALYYGVPEDKVKSLSKLIKLDAGVAAKTLSHLGTLVVSESGAPLANYSGAELARASFDADKSANFVFAQRASQAVQIQTLDATGLSIALALAASGIGHILSPDIERVSESDCATNAFPRALLGYRRYQAAKLILDSSWPGSRIHPTSRVARTVPRPSVTLITSHQVTDPGEAGRWLAADIPVLEICYESDGVRVSPILDGNFGCLNCQTHRLQDADPTHTAVATQLLESTMRFDDAASRLIGGGFAVKAILQFIDGAQPNGLAHRITFEPEPRVATGTWTPHQECACQLRNQLRLDVAV